MRIGTVTNLTPIEVRETSRSRSTPHEIISVADSVGNLSVGDRVMFELIQHQAFIFDRLTGSVPFVNKSGDTMDGGLYIQASDHLVARGWTPNADAHLAPESDWPVGLSFVQANNTSGAAWPGNGYVFIESFCGMGVRSFQTVIDTVGARFYRHWSSSGWQPWQRISAGLWAAVAFQNGWMNYGGSHATAAYTAESGNTVRLKGLVKSGTTGTIFSVDSERAPSEIHIYNCMSNTGQARVDVNTNGTVVLVGYYNGGSNGWVSLAGITWRYG